MTKTKLILSATLAVFSSQIDLLAQMLSSLSTLIARQQQNERRQRS